MICEVQALGNFGLTWLTLALLAFTSMMLMSGSLFWYLYSNPTYETWRYKTNEQYVAPARLTLPPPNCVNYTTLLLSPCMCGVANQRCATHPCSLGARSTDM